MTDVQAAIERSAGGIDQARWSVSVVDLETGRSLGEWEPDANLATASIGKLLVLVELAARACSGEADLRAVVMRSDADRVGDSGLWQHLLVDELCLADLASLVGAVSDNLATNVLLRPGTDLSMVAAAFGLDPLAHTGPDRGVRLCNKTGTDRGVRADVGIVDGPRGRVAYAVLVNWTEAATGHDRSRDRVLDAMRQIGAAIRSLVVDGATAADGR